MTEASGICEERKADQVLLFSEVDTRSIVISRPIASTANGRGPTSYNMFVGTAGRQPFRFQMSRSGPAHRNTVVFPPDVPNNGGTRVNMALSIPKVDVDVLSFWSKVDDVVIAHTAKYSKEFLKREMTEDEVRAIYTPSIRMKEDYENFLKVRFDTTPRQTLNEVKMFDVNELRKRYSPLHHSRLSQGDVVTCIVQLGMVYFFNQKVGVTVDVSHLTRYVPPPPNEFPFQLGAEYSQCAPNDLFKDQSPTSEVTGQQELEISQEQTDTEKQSGELISFPDDGSTVVIDPVTLLPLKSCTTDGFRNVKSARGSETEGPQTSRDVKRRR